jgi:hypothetical protein
MRFRFTKVTLVLSALILLQSCKIRGFSSVKNETNPADKGVDLMDLSILFPPALSSQVVPYGPIEQMGESYKTALAPVNQLIDSSYWPKLVSDSDGFLSEQLFQRAISPVLGTYSSEFSPSMFRFSNTFKLVGIDQTYNLNMAESTRWRIVSFRFSPCPYETHFKEIDNRDQKCTPEIRLVAQPILGGTVEEALLAQALPVAMNQVSVGRPMRFGNAKVGYTFGDYGMHLFFRLDGTAEATELANQLHELKINYDGSCRTTGEPMGPHPCLLKEASQIIAGKIAPESTFAANALKIIKLHAKKLHRISIWGSTQNAGPWGFYFGEIVNDDFVWKNIPTILPNTFSSNDHKNPFQAGKAMHYTRGSSASRSSALGGTRANDASTIISDSKTSRPDPRPKQFSLQRFLLNQLRFLETGLLVPSQGQAVNREDRPTDIQPLYSSILDWSDLPKAPFIKETGRYISDLIQTTEKIDDPTISSELNVDCISCHLSKSEGIFVRRASPLADQDFSYYALKSLESNPGRLGGEYNKLIDTEWYPWQVKVGYSGPKYLSDFTHKVFQTHRANRFGEVYILNQFSVYFDHPMVSSRVVNESAEAANFVNTRILNKPNPLPISCNKDALKMCLLSGPNPNFDDDGRKKYLVPYSSSPLDRVDSCKDLMCDKGFADWTHESELQRVEEDQKVFAEKLANQMAYLALRRQPLPNTKGLTKSQQDIFGKLQFEKLSHLGIERNGQIPLGSLTRIWSSGTLGSKAAEPSVSLQIQRIGSDSIEGKSLSLELVCRYNADIASGKSEVRKELKASGMAEFAKENDALVGIDIPVTAVTGSALREAISADSSAESCVPFLPKVKQGDLIKIVQYSKSAVFLEWPQGLQEIYISSIINADGSYPRFTRPSFLSESEIFNSIVATVLKANQK